MRYAKWMLCLGFLCIGTLQADDPPAKNRADDNVLLNQLIAIRSEWYKLQNDFYEKQKSITNETERENFIREHKPHSDPFVERCLKLARENPSSYVSINAMLWGMSSDAAPELELACSNWLITNWIDKADPTALYKSLKILPNVRNEAVLVKLLERIQPVARSKEAVPVLAWLARHSDHLYLQWSAKVSGTATLLMIQNHIEAREMGQICMSLARWQNPKWTDALKLILEKTPHTEVKAKASLALGIHYSRQESTQSDAEKLFDKVVYDFPELDKSLKELAKIEKTDMLQRDIGKPALEIAGKDLDDKDFKLTDYKGKVVLLDFWGFW